MFSSLISYCQYKLPLIYKYAASFICILMLLTGACTVNAQISFPKSNVVDTIINVDVAYDETRIFFNTGKYKSSDYRYEKVSDSIHPDWLVTSCFNGECVNFLSDYGRFIADFGINDTTCFIAFHVESHDINGKSKIHYKVINTKDSADIANLYYDITYRSPTGITEFSGNNMAQFSCYPNPASGSVNIASADNKGFNVMITSLQGQTLINRNYTQTGRAAVDVSQLKSGLYIVRVQQGKAVFTHKLNIQ